VVLSGDAWRGEEGWLRASHTSLVQDINAEHHQHTLVNKLGNLLAREGRGLFCAGVTAS
jgi:hypothetical protein